ncbi:MAG: MotA/TolQ/ExbB proton channel family protein [Desulfobacterales bacterium]
MQLLEDVLYYFYQGGPIMLPLLGISLWAWGLIAERIYFFFVNTGPDMELDLVDQHLPKTAAPFSDRCGQVCHAMALGFCEQRCGAPDLDSRILEENWLRQKKRIHRGLSMLAALAAAAPLLGLFGTVLGMIDTFEVISLFGTGNARALAGGISEAMISTQSGLLVGIPALLMCIFLRQQARRLETRLNAVRMRFKRTLKQ